MSSSNLNSCFGVLSVLGFGIGRYPSWNCSGGGNMISSVTLSHFSVLGGVFGFFHWFINNLINCPLVSFLRSSFSISILYGLVFNPIAYGGDFYPTPPYY